MSHADALRQLASRVGFAARKAKPHLGAGEVIRLLSPLYEVLDDIGQQLQSIGPRRAVKQEMLLLRSLATRGHPHDPKSIPQQEFVEKPQISQRAAVEETRLPAAMGRQVPPAVDNLVDAIVSALSGNVVEGDGDDDAVIDAFLASNSTTSTKTQTLPITSSSSSTTLPPSTPCRGALARGDVVNVLKHMPAAPGYERDVGVVGAGDPALGSFAEKMALFQPKDEVVAVSVPVKRSGKGYSVCAVVQDIQLPQDVPAPMAQDEVAVMLDLMHLPAVSDCRGDFRTTLTPLGLMTRLEITTFILDMKVRKVYGGDAIDFARWLVGKIVNRKAGEDCMTFV